MMTLMHGLLQAATALPMPYAPQADSLLTLLLLGCFFLTAYILAHSRKFLMQQLKDFLLHRERVSIFATSTAADMRYQLMLIFQTCVLGGVTLFALFCKAQPGLPFATSAYSLLGIYVGICLLALCAKWLLYLLVGWTFFGDGKTALWIESYFTLIYYFGFFLFPLALLMIYCDLNLQTSLIIGLVGAFFAKILAFYKWLKLFCNNLYGCFLLILYFCALEIAPCLLLYQGVVRLNECLIIKI